MPDRLHNWKNVNELFDALNNSGVRYVVLRNYENMHSAEFFCGEHEDIDILVDDIDGFEKVTHARRKMWPEDNIHFIVFIDGLGVPVDARCVGDSYYDNSWEADMLDRRKMASNGNWYVMDDKDYYHSLVYHAYYQKKEISPDYAPKLRMMAENIGLEGQNTDDHVRNVDEYMRSFGYQYSKPDDPSIPIHFDISKQSRPVIGKTGLKDKLKSGKKADMLREMRYKYWQRQLDPAGGTYRDINRASRRIFRDFGEDLSEQLTRRRLFRYIYRYRDEILTEYEELKKTLSRPVNPGIGSPVFTIWEQGIGDAPVVVQRCIESFSKLGREVVVLSSENLDDYISLPAYISDKYDRGIISPSDRREIICMYVLAMYGGIWADCSLYVARPVPEYMKGDFYVLKKSSGHDSIPEYMGWWISSCRGNELIIWVLSALYIYWKHEDGTPGHTMGVFMSRALSSHPELTDRFTGLSIGTTEGADLLQNAYHREFNEKEWEYMKEISPVFKCSYKVSAYDTINTYYSRLCEGTLT